MSIIPQLIANGIIAGGIYSLVALGYTMVYGILKFINFAHGEIFMIGAYIAWLFNVVFGVNILIAFLISMIGCAILGFIIEKVAYKPLRKASRLAPLITAIGISLLLQSIALLLFGAQIRTFRTGTIERGIPILGASITKIQIIIILVSLILMLLLHFFVKYSRTGKAIRAVADNPELASTIGINVDKVISIVFIIGSALAAAAGVLIGIEQNLQPTMGVSIGIKAFT
ncbi:MAG: branched-chain amino acid ABC transporter permease, partial [Nanoarchaeota archaeon]